MKARIYVMYGQFGYITSMGMADLAGRLAKLHPDCMVTTHSWYDINIITPQIRSITVPVILIGYSLGANSVTIAGAEAKGAPIALGVCYDPSVSGQVVQPTSNIKRLLLYHNLGGGLLGHAIFTGPQVERTDVNQMHLGVCFNEMLHQKTIEAVARIC